MSKAKTTFTATFTDGYVFTTRSVRPLTHLVEVDNTENYTDIGQSVRYSMYAVTTSYAAAIKKANATPRATRIVEMTKV